MELKGESWPPLGMLYIAESLKQTGHEVKICDQESQLLSSEGVVRWIKRYDPEIVGFGPNDQSLRTTLQISEMVKKWNENVIIVYGNALGTFADRQILSNYEAVDFCLRREAEKTFPRLVEMATGHVPPTSVDGLSYKEHGLVKRTPDAPLNRDLDALPIPDRDELIDFEYKNGANKFTLVASSRGCPFNCKFCAIGLVSNSRGVWRPRSIDNVMAELHFLESCGFKEFGFVDDDINANPKRTMELCQRMRKEKIDMVWASEGRVTYATKDLLRTMRAAGCNTVLFGIESVNQRTLDYYNKRITPAQSKQAVKNARSAGIENVAGLFIVGAPHETRSDIIQTLRFGLDLDLTALAYHMLYIPIESIIWKEGVRRGLIDENRDWTRKVYAVDVFPGSVRRDHLERLIENALSEFLSRPRFLLKEAFRGVKSAQRLQVFLNIFKGNARKPGRDAPGIDIKQ